MSADIDPAKTSRRTTATAAIPIVTASACTSGTVALWSRAEAGVAPYRLEVIYGRGYGFSLHAADGPQFWLGSDGMIPTWSSAGWTKRFGADLVAERAQNPGDFNRVASTIGGYVVFPRNRVGQTGWMINQARDALLDR